MNCNSPEEGEFVPQKISFLRSALHACPLLISTHPFPAPYLWQGAHVYYPLPLHPPPPLPCPFLLTSVWYVLSSTSPPNPTPPPLPHPFLLTSVCYVLSSITEHRIYVPAPVRPPQVTEPAPQDEGTTASPVSMSPQVNEDAAFREKLRHMGKSMCWLSLVKLSYMWIQLNVREFICQPMLVAVQSAKQQFIFLTQGKSWFASMCQFTIRPQCLMHLQQNALRHLTSEWHILHEFFCTGRPHVIIL